MFQESSMRSLVLTKKEFYAKNAQYRRLQSSLMKFAKDQQSMNIAGFSGNEHLRALTGDHNIGDGAQKEMFKNIGVLNSVFPEKSRLKEADDVFGKKKFWNPYQLKIIEDGLEAINNPDKVMMDLIMNRAPVSMQKIKMLRKAHSEFVKQMQVKIIGGINSGLYKLSYVQKLKLAHLFDMPIKSIMTAEAQMTVDKMWQQETMRRRNLGQRGSKLPSVVDVRDNAAARAAAIRG